MAIVKKSMIKYYQLRKYERFQNMTLEELIEMKTKIDNGLINLKEEKLVGNRMNKEERKKLKESNPETDVRKVQELGIRRFILHAMEDIQVKAMIEKRQNDIAYLRQIYSVSNLTKQEVCYILGVADTAINFYIHKYKIKKIPGEARIKINDSKSLVKFLKKPRFEMVTPNTSETDVEFRERYKALTFRAYGRLQDIIAYGEENEGETKDLNTAISALGVLMKVELESKRLLTVEKESVIELKRKEMEKGVEKTPVVINFGGDINLQTMFVKFKEMAEAKGMDEDDLSDMLLSMNGVSDLN